jgi:hypothetical protein
MSSERQIIASRANGSKSRGPVTPEGKRASSRNATTHGMLADAIVMEDESEDRFRALLTALHEEFQPQTPFEESLIENMAAVRWRQIPSISARTAVSSKYVTAAFKNLFAKRTRQVTQNNETLSRSSGSSTSF